MARRQLAAGASGLCVATVTEAGVLTAAGLTDLTLAYPVVGPRKLARLAAVCRTAGLTLVADSAAVADGYQELAAQTGRVLTVLVEVDTGMHRTGAAPLEVPALARHIARSPGAGIRRHPDPCRPRPRRHQPAGHRAGGTAGSGHHGRRPGRPGAGRP